MLLDRLAEIEETAEKAGDYRTARGAHNFLSKRGYYETKSKTK